MDQKDSKSVEIVHEAMHDPAHVARYLRAIADGLEGGRLRLRNGEREIELQPASVVTFELRTARERDRIKLSLQLGWREAEEGVLEITST
jgi:amphi-Trp domain-containing protein